MQKEDRLLFLIICAAFISCILLSNAISTMRLQMHLHKEGNNIESINDVASKISENFRQFLAAVSWIKAEVYFHGGWERKEYVEIPSRLNPYVAKHEHNEDNLMRMLPWYWLTTLFDPHFVRAYANGSFWLVFHLNKVDEGIAYLREGISNNPDSYLMYYVLGRIYFTKYNNPETAVAYFTKALSLPIDTEEDREEIYRYLIFSYEKLGDLETSLKFANEAYQKCPLYPRFKKYIGSIEKQIQDKKTGIVSKEKDFIEKEIKSHGEFFDPHNPSHKDEQKNQHEHNDDEHNDAVHGEFQ